MEASLRKTAGERFPCFSVFGCSVPEREEPRAASSDSFLGKANDMAACSFANLFLLELPSALCRVIVCLAGVRSWFQTFSSVRF